MKKTMKKTTKTATGDYRVGTQTFIHESQARDYAAHHAGAVIEMRDPVAESGWRAMQNQDEAERLRAADVNRKVEHGKRFIALKEDREEDQEFGEVIHRIGDEFIVGAVMAESRAGLEYQVAWQGTALTIDGREVPADGMWTVWSDAELQTEAVPCDRSVIEQEIIDGRFCWDTIGPDWHRLLAMPSRDVVGTYRPGLGHGQWVAIYDPAGKSETKGHRGHQRARRWLEARARGEWMKREDVVHPSAPPILKPGDAVRVNRGVYAGRCGHVVAADVEVDAGGSQQATDMVVIQDPNGVFAVPDCFLVP